MLFLIHGWATNSMVWPKWLKQEAIEYDEADFPNYSSIEQALLTCWQEKKEKISILGWSLGGMLALELAKNHSDKIKQLILVSTTAKFTKNEFYQAGLNIGIVKNLQRKLERNQQQTQADFYKLMFSNTEEAYTPMFLAVQAECFYRLNLVELQKGLSYLLDKDLSGELQQIKVPCAIIHGLEDQICLPAAAEYLQENIIQAKSYFLEHAGHIPFLTQEQQFRDIIEECLGGNVENAR